MGQPLFAFPLVSTDDTDEAQSVLSREMASLRFRRVRNPHRFQLTMNGVHIGKTMVGFNRFSTETDVEAGVVDDAVMLTLCLGPPTIPYVDGEPVSPDRGTITAPRRHLAVHREAGSSILILRSSIGAIEERLEEVLGRRLNKPVVFDSDVDLRQGVGAEVKRLLTFAIDNISSGQSSLQYPLLRSGLDEVLLNALVSLPNNYSAEIADHGQAPVVPGVVRRAEDFMEAHAAEPISISDVVASCGCSRRTLFNSFQQFRGYTPMQFLADFRLNWSRDALQSPAPGDTVRSIAYACGFMHLGRFSRTYRQRFGERPSETLRRAGIQRSPD